MDEWMDGRMTLLCLCLGVGSALALPLLCLGFALVLPWLGLGLALAVPWLGFGFALALHLLCLGFALALPLHLRCACTMKTEPLYHRVQMSSQRMINDNPHETHISIRFRNILTRTACVSARQKVRNGIVVALLGGCCRYISNTKN